MVEFNNGPNIDLNISAGLKYKNDSTAIPVFADASIDLKLEDLLHNKDVEMGQAEVYYFDPTNFIMDFPNVEFKIQLTDEE